MRGLKKHHRWFTRLIKKHQVQWRWFTRLIKKHQVQWRRNSSRGLQNITDGYQETSQMVIKKHHRWLSRNIRCNGGGTTQADFRNITDGSRDASRNIRCTRGGTAQADFRYTKCVVREALRSNRGKQQKADFRNTKCVVQEALRKLYDCPLTTKSALFGSVIDETYQEEHVRRLPIQRAIALRSPCGTGKTKATHELLKELSEKTSISVVWVVHRKALSREAQQKLPCLGGNEWKHYKDIEGPIDISEHALVIAQYESLSRITGLERTKTTLVVVLDEFNSLCNQMDSTYGDVVMAQKRFYDLFKYSDHIIAMDGHLDKH